jgi:heme exporter protein C
MVGAWWKIGAGLLMIFVIYGAFFIAKGAAGFGENGDKARAVFFHVPSAILASVCYFVGIYFALIYLFGKKSGNLEDDAKSAISMELGFLFCLLATVTGSIFAGIQWGVFWNWDPRETSIVITLLLYASYLILRGALNGQPAKRANLSAVYALVALVPEQFLIWAVPRIMDTNHPTSVLQNPSNTSIDYKIVLYTSFLAFTLLFIWLFQLKLRTYRLQTKQEG